MPVTQDQQLATIADLENLSIAGDALRDLKAPQKTQALIAASSEVMEALRAQFVLPLVSWGLGVKQVVCDIAAWKLLANRGFSAEGGDENIRIAAEDARKRLERWASDRGAVPDVIDSAPSAVEGRPSALPLMATSESRGFSLAGLNSRFAGLSRTNRPPFTGG